MEGRQPTISKYKLRVLVGFQLNDALGVVDHIAGAVQLCYHRRARRQLGQVDGPVLQRGHLHRAPAPVYRLQLEPCVGDGLGEVGAVHLDEVDAGFYVVEEQQLLDAIPGVELHLLGGSIQNQPVITSIYLEGAIGAGLSVGNQNLTHCICLKIAQKFAVPIDCEGNLGQQNHIFPIIFDDAQAGQLLVDDSGCGLLAGHHSHGLDGVGLSDPALDTSHLFHLVTARFQMVKDHRTAHPRLAGDYLSALDVLDLHRHPVEGVAGVGQLLHSERAIRGVPKSQLYHLVIFHIGVLGGDVGEKMILGRDLLGHGVVALQGEWDGDRSVGAGGVGAQLPAHRVIDGEDCPLQGHLGTLLQLDDPQRRFIRDFLLRGIVVIADGSQFHALIVVHIADVVLQIAVLVLLCTDSVHDSVLGHRGGQGELDAACLSLDAVHGIEHLKAAQRAICDYIGDILVVHIHNAGPGRDTAGVGKGHTDLETVDKGLAAQSKDLLLILSAVYRYRVGHRLVRGGGELGLQHVVVGGTALVNGFGRMQYPVGNLLVRGAQAGGHLQIIDVPCGHEIAPQGHFSGVIRLILVIQIQALQAVVGIAVTDDTHHLGVAGLFVGQILDALARAHSLGNAKEVRVDAVGWCFSDITV